MGLIGAIQASESCCEHDDEMSRHGDCELFEHDGH
jgi:hypothetical protein